MTFAELGLSKPILRAIDSEGYDAPTPIQARSIPSALAGRDLLGCAQTGTGKTGAFSMPILHRLASSPSSRRPRALVLCPTRELASQITDSLTRYGTHLPLKHLAIFGGVSQNGQVRRLKSGVDILVATPGRLMDLMNQGYVKLSSVEVLVLDEADRMLDMGFINDIRRITQHVPTKRQTMLFSATMPREIEQLAASQLNDPVRVEVTPVASTVDAIQQSVYLIDKPNKASLLRDLLSNDAMSRTLVFTRTKHGADKVVKTLNKSGIEAAAIHGNKSQNARTRALDGFKAGRTRVLVATDIASRGIDVDGITHVINYDLPAEAETYVHRIGRTARAGRSGVAISFCDDSERSLLRAIERVTKKKLARSTYDGRGSDGRSEGRPEGRGARDPKRSSKPDSSAPGKPNRGGTKRGSRTSNADRPTGPRKKPRRKSRKSSGGNHDSGRGNAPRGAKDSGARPDKKPRGSRVNAA